MGDVRTTTLVRLLSRASTARLEALAASGTARPMVLDEVFRRMSTHLLVDRAAGVAAVVWWRIGCGQPDFQRFQTVIEGGSCVTDAELDRAPRVTLTLPMADFLRLATGNVGAARLWRADGCGYGATSAWRFDWVGCSTFRPVEPCSRGESKAPATTPAGPR